MSGASPSPGVSSTAPPGGAFHRVREFWERISEGRQLDDLWLQFAADARAGYGFYGKDVDWDAIQKLPRWRRPFYVAKDIFWATLMKMTPARRVLLLLALAMLLMSGFTFQFGHDVGIQFKFESFAALIFLLLIATLQASLRTIAGEGAPVAELVTRLNRYASAYSLDGRRFTTAVLCEYQPASRRLTYVNAGHNAPILRRANGALEKLEIGGLPLGIKVDATYETASLELRPGDALILFTDGVIEAFNASGEEFGNERWLATVRGLPDWSGHLCLRYLMERVDQFVGGTRQADDITCLVFRSK